MDAAPSVRYATERSRFSQRPKLATYVALGPQEWRMAVYFFNLKVEDILIRDRDGTICSSDDAARDQGRQIAKELMRNREVRCRPWRMQVCNVLQTPLFEIVFVEEDETLSTLPVELARSIREVSTTLAKTWDTVAKFNPRLESASE